jgi:hypothetical protein
VDDTRIAQAPAPITPDPEDQARLLAAAKDALAWLERFDAHAPEGLNFGGEARVRRQLRRAIRGCDR